MSIDGTQAHAKNLIQERPGLSSATKTALWVPFNLTRLDSRCKNRPIEAHSLRTASHSRAANSEAILEQLNNMMSHSVTGNLTERVDVCCVRLRLWHSSPDPRDMQISYPASLYKSVFIILTSTSFAPLRSLPSREPVASQGCVAILAPIISDPARQHYVCSNLVHIRDLNFTDFAVAMKANFIATTAIVAAVVSAQTTTTPATSADPSSSVSTVTEYYNTCTSSEESTTTATTTETYCPICEAMSMSTYAGGSMTVYTTVFSTVCSGSLAPATYTITEPCPSTGAERPSDYIPQGFVATTVPCGCAENTPVTITTPAPAYTEAAKSLPAAASASPTPAAPEAPAAASAAPAEAPAEAPASGSPAAPAAPAEAPAEAPASGSPAEGAAAAPPYPSPPAQAAYAAAATGSSASNSSGIQPFNGSASTMTAYSMSFIIGLMGLIAPLMFGL